MQMVACFFCNTGHVPTVTLEHCRTINSEWYTTICLPKVFEEIRKTNKRRRIIVHHGNASSHKSGQISGLLTGQNVEFMDYPPHKTDKLSNGKVRLHLATSEICQARNSSINYPIIIIISITMVHFHINML